MNKLTYFKSICGLFIYCTEIDTTSRVYWIKSTGCLYWIIRHYSMMFSHGHDIIIMIRIILWARRHLDCVFIKTEVKLFILRLAVILNIIPDEMLCNKEGQFICKFAANAAGAHSQAVLGYLFHSRIIKTQYPDRARDQAVFGY